MTSAIDLRGVTRSAPGGPGRHWTGLRRPSLRLPDLQWPGLRRPAPRSPRVSATLLENLTLQVPTGTVCGLLGASPAEVTALIRLLVGLDQPDTGTVSVAGIPTRGLRGAQRRQFQRSVSLLLPSSPHTLDPRWRIDDLIVEGLRAHGCADRRERQAQAAALAAECELPAEVLRLRPGQVTDGQRQRICIARALALEPAVLILADPVAGLDRTVQARLLSLLQHVQRRRGLTCLVTGSDAAVLEHFCDRLAVIDDGQLIEEGPAAEVVAAPQHPHTRGLLASALAADPRQRTVLPTLRIPRPGPAAAPSSAQADEQIGGHPSEQAGAPPHRAGAALPLDATGFIDPPLISPPLFDAHLFGPLHTPLPQPLVPLLTAAPSSQAQQEPLPTPAATEPTTPSALAETSTARTETAAAPHADDHPIGAEG